MGTLVEETGVYYVAVDGSSFVADAPYEFTVSVNGTDAFEPNQDHDSATPIDPGETFEFETAAQQELLDGTTRMFGPGEHTITVDVPDSDEEDDA